MTTALELKRLVFNFLSDAHPRHETMAFRKKQHIGLQKWKALEIEYQMCIRDMAAGYHNFNNAGRLLEEENGGTAEEKEVTLVMRALKGMAVEGKNAFAAKVWLQCKGKLTEKQEVTHKIDGSVYARAALEAERQLGREQTGGMAQMQKKPKLLRPKLCLPEGQETTPDYSV